MSDLPPSLEKLDDRVRQADELVERWDNWRRRQTLGFVERYLSGDTKIAIRCINTGPAYHGAILESRPLAGHPQALRPSGRGDHYSERHQVYADEPVMFPCHIEAMNGVKHVIPTRVRFQTFYDRAIRRGEPLFAFRFVHRVNEVLVAGVKRKMVVGSWRYAVAPREGCGQQIKTGADAVDHGPDSRIQACGQSLVYLQLQQLLPHLRVRLFNEEIWGAVEPGLEGMLEGVEVGSGPVDGPIGIFEVGTHG